MQARKPTTIEPPTMDAFHLLKIPIEDRTFVQCMKFLRSRDNRLSEFWLEHYIPARLIPTVRAQCLLEGLL